MKSKGDALGASTLCPKDPSSFLLQGGGREAETEMTPNLCPEVTTTEQEWGLPCVRHIRKATGVQRSGEQFGEQLEA